MSNMSEQKLPEKRALARGLSSLLGGSSNAAISIPQQQIVSVQAAIVPENDPSRATLIEVNVEQVEANPNQPRKHFNEGALQELALSLQEQGVIQPIVVIRMGENRYQIVAGERRWRAAQIAKLSKIPVIVREIQKSTADNDLASLIENVQREDLNPVELAEAYERILKVQQITQEELAKRLGVSRVTLTNSIRLLKLPEDVKKLILERRLSEGHARAMLALEDEKQILDFAQLVVNLQLSVREVEARVRAKVVEQKNGSRNSDSTKAADGILKSVAGKSPELLSLEDEMRQLFGTKVNIAGKASGGVIEIYYSGTDSLRRIIHRMRSSGEA